MESGKIEEQEKNEIDYSKFSEEPEKLFPLAKENFYKNEFETGIDILEHAITLAVKKYGGENKVELSLYYNKYADGILQKLMHSNQDYLNLQEEKNEKNEKPKQENDNEKESEEPKQENEIVDDDDEQVIFDNLNAANSILLKYLETYNDKEPKDLDKEITKYYLILSDNYSLFANLEKLNSNFKGANEYLVKSINLSKKYDDKYSRNLAGLYFEQAQILDYDPHGCLLSLYKTQKIMEHHLQIELDKIKSGIVLKIEDSDLDLESISYDNTKIFENKEIIETSELIKNAAKENFNIEDLVEIIKDINIKIEDVIMELKEYNLFLKTKEEMKKNNESQNSFKTDIDLSKVMDITNINLIRKKRKEPDNSNDDIKKIDDSKKIKKDE